MSCPIVPPSKFRSPRCPLGLVLWSPGLNMEWFPAIATQVGGECIRVMVFPVESRVAMVKDSVRHVSDPMFPRLLDQTGGVWDYTDEYKLLAAVAQIVMPDKEGYSSIPTKAALKLRPEIGGLVYIPETGTRKGSNPGDRDYTGA